jgi:hypothetical protein
MSKKPSSTMGSREGLTGILQAVAGSSGRTRTYNQPVNSRSLCQLSYRGLPPLAVVWLRHPPCYILWLFSPSERNVFGETVGRKRSILRLAVFNIPPATEKPARCGHLSGLVLPCRLPWVTAHLRSPARLFAQRWPSDSDWRDSTAILPERKPLAESCQGQDDPPLPEVSRSP